ncbi:MAG: hypothetical protein M3395_07885 [Chloroflexota bacterium]|nr:hypothetical protein [Chloroflexota bacterium]
MTSLGLVLTRGVPRSGWRGQRGSASLSFVLQFSKWNYGESRDGYEFTAEVQVDRGGLSGAGGRLFDFLTADEREEHRRIQNLVIAKLPLDEAELEHLPPAWQADRLVRVAPRLAPYAPSMTHVWFRYMDEDDVRAWMRFIGRVLPGALDRFWAEADIGGGT